MEKGEKNNHFWAILRGGTCTKPVPNRVVPVPVPNVLF